MGWRFAVRFYELISLSKNRRETSFRQLSMFSSQKYSHSPLFPKNGTPIIEKNGIVLRTY